MLTLQGAAAEVQPATEARQPASEAIESPSQMAASDRIEDSDKEGAAKAPQPIAAGIQQPTVTICSVMERAGRSNGR